ncbi:DNA polymerase III subunit delta [Ornithinibacillus gellani]|uniref:DNA polymerase III subunit delta n=1 Tax=Ornithinibacillus gellani TaxID=2293253 RepID=UPI000F49D937|nr:DNA polymerase III subunit delta [Ornithinibacillus gellani]TQS74598.1 DNA polymerase III subunit delta [Ornithinibacillus gellani]
MNFNELLKRIKQGKIPSVCLLYGTESYFIQRAKTTLAESVLTKDEEAVVYDLEETPIEDVIADVETYPFFSDRKLIIATNPVFLKAKPDKLAFEHELTAFERYLEQPVDYSVFVIIAPYEKVDERKKLVKLLKKRGTVVECNPVKPGDINQWLNQLAKAKGITIDSHAYEIFESELSGNLQMLESEVEKLALYVGEDGIVTKEIAADLISRTANSSSMMLADAVIERNLHKAISISKELQIMKEEPIALIALLAFQFRTMLRVKLLKQKGYTQQQIQRQIGAHPYVIKIAWNREGRFSMDRLKQVMDNLANTDAAMKQGKMEKNLAFELLLYNLIQDDSVKLS